ncbi:MAG: response regulator [Spirochaetales bacterium]|nr:response regulator [Spirochaetales bacterium]
MDFERILIVDDSETSRLIIRRCFEIAGYDNSTYLEAEDGLRAVSILQEQPVDLILSDLRMPRMDGNTLIKKLKMRETTKGIPVVVISSVGNDRNDEELYQEGVKAIIRKPISPKKVAHALGEP